MAGEEQPSPAVQVGLGAGQRPDEVLLAHPVYDEGDDAVLVLSPGRHLPSSDITVLSLSDSLEGRAGYRGV